MNGKRLLTLIEKRAAKNTPRTQYVLPEGLARPITSEEQERFDENSSDLLPALFTSEGTPAEKFLASPEKQGIAVLLGTALAGGIIGYNVNSDGTKTEKLKNVVKGAGVGAIPGLLLGLVQYNRRKDENEEIIDKIRRFPRGSFPTRRDLDAEPVKTRYQLGGTQNTNYSMQ